MREAHILNQITQVVTCEVVQAIRNGRCRWVYLSERGAQSIRPAQRRRNEDWSSSRDSTKNNGTAHVTTDCRRGVAKHQTRNCQPKQMHRTRLVMKSVPQTWKMRTRTSWLKIYVAHEIQILETNKQPNIANISSSKNWVNAEWRMICCNYKPSKLSLTPSCYNPTWNRLFTNEVKLF